MEAIEATRLLHGICVDVRTTRGSAVEHQPEWYARLVVRQAIYLVYTRMFSQREFGHRCQNNHLAPFSSQIPELFEYENEVLHATVLPQVSPCAQRVERGEHQPERCARLVKRCSVSSVQFSSATVVVCIALLYLFDDTD